MLPGACSGNGGRKGPSTAGFGTRSECKKWALAKTNASRNPSRDAQCAAVISSTWGAKLIARATRVPRYRMSSASKRHGGRFLRRDAGYGEALKQIKLNEGFALRHARTLEDFPMHHFNQYSSIMGFLRTFNPKDACVVRGIYFGRGPTSKVGEGSSTVIFSYNARTSTWSALLSKRPFPEARRHCVEEQHRIE